MACQLDAIDHDSVLSAFTEAPAFVAGLTLRLLAKRRQSLASTNLAESDARHLAVRSKLVRMLLADGVKHNVDRTVEKQKKVIAERDAKAERLKSVLEAASTLLNEASAWILFGCSERREGARRLRDLNNRCGRACWLFGTDVWVNLLMDSLEYRTPAHECYGAFRIDRARKHHRSRAAKTGALIYTKKTIILIVVGGCYTTSQLKFKPTDVPDTCPPARLLPFYKVTYNGSGPAKPLQTCSMNFIFIPHKLAAPGVFSMASQIETASDALALLYKTGTLKQHKEDGNDKQSHSNGTNGRTSGRSSFDDTSSPKTYANVLKEGDHHHRNGTSPGLTDDRMMAFDTAGIAPKHDPEQPENGEIKPYLDKAKVAKLTNGILKQAYQQNAKAESTEAVNVNHVSFDMSATAHNSQQQRQPQQPQSDKQHLEQQLQNLENYMEQRKQEQQERENDQRNRQHDHEEDEPQQHDDNRDYQGNQESEQQNDQADGENDDNEGNSYYDREAAHNFTFAVLRQTRDPAYLDFTISNNDTDYKVNSLIISSLSTAFQEVIMAAKVSIPPTTNRRKRKRLHNQPIGATPPNPTLTPSFQDANESRVELKSDAPLAVKTMIDFFKTLNYNTPKTLTRLEAAQHHVAVFLIAEKYDIPGLRDLAVWRFERPFSDWGYSKDVLVRMLPDLTQFVYANTPEKCPIRVALLRIWANALRPRNFVSVDFEPLVDEFPSFGADIIHVLASFASRHGGPDAGYDDYGNAMGPDGFDSGRGGGGGGGGPGQGQGRYRDGEDGWNGE